MLPLLIGLLVAGGPLLRGSWDLWAQSALFIAVVVGSAAWLIGRIAVGYIPSSTSRALAWSGALAALAGLSALASPLPSDALASWRVLALGLWIFPALTIVSKDERAWIDAGLRAGAWALVLLAFYQHYHDKVPRPPSALLNENVFAGTVLMLLPIAVQSKDWLLTAALVLALVWVRSVGAWLGLAAALMLMRRSAGWLSYRLGAAIGAVCLVMVYARLQSPEVLHRWHWWAASLRMSWARPFLGFGPGTFAKVLPAYELPGRDLSTLYAHEHWLETAAECGWPYVVLWSAGLVHLLRRGGPHKRFGALAILVQSLCDYPLSIPANFWLFCYLTGSSVPESSRGVNVPGRLKLPSAAFAAFVALALTAWTWRRWEADRLKAQAVEALAERPAGIDATTLLDRSLRLAADPEAERLQAELLWRGGRLREAALHLERAAALNPYRASNWTALERVYSQLGEPETGRRLRDEGAGYCPVLRVASGS